MGNSSLASVRSDFSRDIRRRLSIQIPTWAKWMAYDATGELWLYSMMPNIHGDEWQMDEGTSRVNDRCTKIGKIVDPILQRHWRASRIYVGDYHPGGPMSRG